jgi:thiol-disulfide isomerase/thioredoxin
MKFLMRRFSGLAPRFLFILAAVLLLCATPTRAFAQGGQSQSGTAEGVAKASGGDEPESVKLYMEASRYAQRKFDEFAKQNVPFSKEREAETFREQRELALKHAAHLSAKPITHGLDLYYLGMLYVLAEKHESAIQTLSRLFTEEGRRVPADTRDDARAVLMQQALKLNRADEATRILADYARTASQKPLMRYRYETILAAHFRAAKNHEKALSHLVEAHHATRRLAEAKAVEPRRRDTLLYGSAAALADSLAQLKRRDEALNALRELRRFAIRLPSARLYLNATSELIDHGGKPDGVEELSRPAAGAGDAKAEAAMLSPEINVNEWVEQKPISLSSLRGQVVLLDFWATWCRPCLVTIPRLNTLHRKYKGRGLVVLGLTTYQGRGDGRPMEPTEEMAFLKQFKRRTGAAYGFAVADTEVNEENYGVSSFPTAVLIDRRGQVRLISIGASDDEAKILEATIKKLLNEPTGEASDK